MNEERLVLPPQYDSGKTKHFMEQVFNKPFHEITKKKFVEKASLWNALLVEMVSDIDHNLETMKMQMMVKQQFMIDTSD